MIHTRTATDLEAHVAADGRRDLVKQVRAHIDKLGIQYIYYQFVSVTGRIVGKGVPADHWESICEKGFQLVYGATANLFVDRHKKYIGYGPEASELVGIPDPETFVQLPWDKRVARVFCTCFRNREEPVDPGAHLTSDCRGNLRILPTYLVDGRVAGTWSIDVKRREATVTLRPLDRLPRGTRAELVDEAERLARTVAPDAKAHGAVVAR